MPRSLLAAALASVALAACTGPDRDLRDVALDHPLTVVDVVRDGPGAVDSGPTDGAADAGADGPAVFPDVALGDAAFPVPDGSSDAPGTLLGACSTVLNVAPVIRETTLTGTAPQPMGGAIEQGWYYLTTADVYVVGPVDPDAGAAVQRQATLLVGDGVIYRIDRHAYDPAVTTTYRFTPGATSPSIVQVCPDPTGAAPVSYDAMGTTLALQYTTAYGRRMDVFTRQ
jgi:hypothetical protein